MLRPRRVAPIVAALALGLVACDRGAPPITPEPVVAVAAPAAPSSVAPVGTEPQAAPASPTEGVCEEPHVWDSVARACRLHPGGGNGWAGCSLAPAPPNGEQCITGTRWERSQCDCVCERAGERWDPRTRACQAP